MRVFDVSNRAFPRLLKIYRFFESENMSINVIKCSHDGRFVIVSSPECDSIFIFSQRPEDDFEVYGFVTLEGYVNFSSFTAHDNKLKVVSVLSNSTLCAFTVPVDDFISKKIVGNIKESLPEEVAHPVYRKIDKGATLVIPNIFTGDLYVTGEDKLLKKYEFPTDHISKLDMKKAPLPPIEEHKSHDIGTNCWHLSSEVKFLVTGGKDGNFILRNLTNIAQSNEIKGHAIFSGGITSLTFSNQRSILYTAGGDGAFFAWTVGNKPNPHHPI
jgi:WD40 repeat protein